MFPELDSAANLLPKVVEEPLPYLIFPDNCSLSALFLLARGQPDALEKGKKSRRKTHIKNFPSSRCLLYCELIYLPTFTITISMVMKFSWQKAESLGLLRASS